MFSGIVRQLGQVSAITTAQGLSRQIRVSLPEPIADIALGDSIAINGVCLTIIARHNNFYDFAISHETAERSNLGALKVGDAVNVEPAIRVTDRLNGHYVQGHVDGQVQLIMLLRADDIGLRLTKPDWLAPFIVPKGYITLDGVSLTVTSTSQRDFSVMILPFTFAHTIMSHYIVGDQINCEVDVLAKYVLQQKVGEEIRNEQH